MEAAQSFIATSIEFMVALFIFVIGLALLVILIIYIMDVTQTKTALLRNYPVIGHFRYFFEHLGEFFRQYFFSMDRQELPFNRAQRSWVYRASKDINNTVAFGSTKDLRKTGAVMFINSPFPTLDEDAVHSQPMTIGEGCRHPYTTTSLVNISGMSFGAISKPAVQALSMGAKQAGIWMNTGEGGLSPYHLEGGCDIVLQIGTAKNGVSDLDGNLDDGLLRKMADHEQLRMFELKLSQGAKPGKGGILPGGKVTEEIAKIRHIRIGEDAISPNRHTDVNSNSDLVDLIEHIREVTGKPVGFKAVISDAGWLDDLFTEINSRGKEFAPDFITVDSADGGTGAALALIDDMGLPLRESLPMLVDKLIEYDLKNRIKVVASGKLITPADVAWALCLGADFCVSAQRGFMFSLGCIQALQCNKNTCPTGITTHDADLQKGLVPESKKDRVAAYAKNLVYEAGTIAHSCGVTEPRGLRRHHARIVMENSLSIRLDQLHALPLVPEKFSEPMNQPVKVEA